MSLLKQFFSKILLKKPSIDEEFFEELEQILVESDIGIRTTTNILEYLKAYIIKEKINDSLNIKTILKDYLKTLIKTENIISSPGLKVILFTGINGVGKTTSLAKLANLLKEKNQKVKIVAADTFRAAAIEQLVIWAKRVNVPIVKSETGADSGAVVYDGIASALNDKTDYLIIDTAGRMHTNEDLMKELQKIVNICLKRVDKQNMENILVVDATTGQNSYIQAETFNRFIPISGVFLSKYDSIFKGGMVIRISNELKIPVKFIGNGETLADIKSFNKDQFIELLGL